MNKPDYLDQLINLASSAAGSDYKLAATLGVSRQTVSNWRHGHKTCPAGDQALMAQLAGLDAEAWVARAVASQYEGTEKGERLAQALKKALVATGAAIISGGAAAGESVGYLIRCINGKGRNSRTASLHGASPHTPRHALRGGPSRASWSPVVSQ